jgi:hypothetical protein
MLFVLGWLIAVAVGIGLLWYGFTRTGDGKPEDTSPTATALATPMPLTILPIGTPLTSPTPLAVLTDTPLPMATEMPTATPTPIPATATPVVATIVAGADGVNVRTGPGTNYTRLGYLEPGAQAELIGRSGGWWQIRYNDAPAWVFGELVTASNADTVPQVEPPTAPTAPTGDPATPVPPAPTAPPPTEAPANYRGLVPKGYQVEGAPGPYSVGADIWFNMWIDNTSGEEVKFKALGTVVEETGQFQQSWTYSEFTPGKHLSWRDHINIPAAGTYKLWMTIGFMDDQCFRMMGPVTVIIQ